MKKRIAFISALFFVFTGYGQSGAGNMMRTSEAGFEAGLKKLAAEYLQDFKNIKGSVKKESASWIVYHSTYVLPGTVESTNEIRYHKEDKLWEYSAHLNDDAITIENIRAVIKKSRLSFGAVKEVASGVEWVWSYIPANKKGATKKTKQFLIDVYDGSENPNASAENENLHRSINLGGSRYYENK